MIDHGTGIVTAGSCFSDNIGQKLSENKFATLVNPLGVCYNPVSIHKGLIKAGADEDLYVESQGMWRHFDFHSKFAASTKEHLKDVLGKTVPVRQRDVTIVTYGTSWVYRHKATGKIVANCHKRPQAEFDKILLSVEEILNSFAELRGFIDGKIIVTLSPVRHVKDTLELNSVSKSILRASIHEMQKHFLDMDYFPAYEIMLDDLRDYRFYEADMIHPSDVAIEYIWEKFSERYFSPETKDVNARWQKVLRSLNHRVFNEGTAQHKNFLKGIMKELMELKTQIDVSKEIETVEQQLNG